VVGLCTVVMMRLVEKGLAKRHKKGTYLIERSGGGGGHIGFEGVDMTDDRQKD
jgi:hypothetical protein